MLKDFLGSPLEVGDIVACNPPYYKGLVRAEIIGTTPQQVNIHFLDRTFWYGDTCRRPAKDVILIQKKATY